MFDCFGGTYCIASIAEDNTIVWIFYNGHLLAFDFFKFVGSEFTVFYAFSAADAFFVVYCGIPGYFASGNSMPSFFRHFVALFLFEYS